MIEGSAPKGTYACLSPRRCLDGIFSMISKKTGDQASMASFIARPSWSVLILVLALLILPAGCAAQQGTPATAGANSRADTRKFKAEVTWIPLEGGFYGLLAEDGSKYLPLNLPAAFQRDGLQVTIEGEPKQVMTIQMWGTPLEIKKIKK